MFQKNHHFYYRLFRLNKLNNSRRTFSCWPIPPSTFAGSQLLQIKNRNYYWQLPCLFHLQPQKLNHIGSRNVGNADHLPTDLNAKLLWLDSQKGKNVKLEFQTGKSGNKYFHIRICRNNEFFDYPKILVPHDAYAFVRALDELIGELVAENFEQKLNIQDNNVGHQPQYKSKLRSVELTGHRHVFQLDLLLFINTDRGMLEKEICLEISSINKIIKRRRAFILPLKTLPWLRTEMAEMLVKYDGTEQIEAPAQIPQQFFAIEASRIATIRNGISSDPGRTTAEEPINNQFDLETRLLELDNFIEKQLELKLKKGKRRGQKFFDISLKKHNGRFHDFTNIPFPKDGYAFVRALDELISDLASDNFEQKLHIQDPQLAIEIANNGPQKTTRILKLRNVEVMGLFHKFHLELFLLLSNNDGEGKIKKEICFEICTINNITMKRRNIINLPLKALPWLRTEMAKILAKYDGTEAIALEAPAEIPQKYFQMDAFNALTPSNDISSVHKFQQIRTRWSKMPNFNQIGDIENANSSSNLIEQNEQYLAEREKSIDHLVLETKFLLLDIHRKKHLRLRLKKGRSGQIFFDITLNRFGQEINFTKIPVPQDAYGFLRGLDELIEDLASDNFEQNLQTQDQSQSNANADQPQPQRYKLTLQSVELIGVLHKFQLKLMLFKNMAKGMMEKQICLELFGIHKNHSHQDSLTLPLEVLPWLRRQMAEMLAKYDGTEEIEKEAPAQIPKYFFARNVFNPNGIYFVHTQTRPQFFNKNLASCQQFTKIPTGIQNSNQIDSKEQKKMFFTPLPVQQTSNFEQSEVKITAKNPNMADLEESTHFDFDDDEMKKYRIGG